MILLDEAARRRDSRLAFIGGSLLLFGTLIQAQADTRHWHLLPAGTQLWLGSIEPGLHSLQLDFGSSSGRDLPAYQQIWHYLPFDGDTLNVYYFRSGYRKGFRTENRDGVRHAGVVERTDT